MFPVEVHFIQSPQKRQTNHDLHNAIGPMYCIA
jgi:hypothetical protein